MKDWVLVHCQLSAETSKFSSFSMASAEELSFPEEKSQAPDKESHSPGGVLTGVCTRRPPGELARGARIHALSALLLKQT